MTLDPMDQDDTDITGCSECGHQHYVGKQGGFYLPCPLAEDGCDCPFREGD